VVVLAVLQVSLYSVRSSTVPLYEPETDQNKEYDQAPKIKASPYTPVITVIENGVSPNWNNGTVEAKSAGLIYDMLMAPGIINRFRLLILMNYLLMSIL
jgi:hypothetical protein